MTLIVCYYQLIFTVNFISTIILFMTMNDNVADIPKNTYSSYIILYYMTHIVQSRKKGRWSDSQ